MRAVRRISRFLVIALSIVLLVDQSVSFSFEQLHGMSSETQILASAQLDVPTHDKGKTRDADSHCSHGCHFYNHFLGQIAQAPSGLPVAVSAEAPQIRPAPRIATAPLEPLYRPPRFSSLA